MFFVDQFLGDLPAYIALASSGHSVLAYGHYDTHHEAVAWCARAMHQHAEAEQIAIARPSVVEWPGFGKVPAIIPFEGWTRHVDGFRQAEARELLRTFDRLPNAPRTLLTDPPASWVSVSAGANPRSAGSDASTSVAVPSWVSERSPSSAPSSRPNSGLREQTVRIATAAASEAASAPSSEHELTQAVLELSRSLERLVSALQRRA